MSWAAMARGKEEAPAPEPVAAPVAIPKPAPAPAPEEKVAKPRPAPKPQAPQEEPKPAVEAPLPKPAPQQPAPAPAPSTTADLAFQQSGFAMPSQTPAPNAWGAPSKTDGAQASSTFPSATSTPAIYPSYSASTVTQQEPPSSSFATQKDADTFGAA